MPFIADDHGPDPRSKTRDLIHDFLSNARKTADDGAIVNEELKKADPRPLYMTQKQELLSNMLGDSFRTY
eukprot:gene9879-2633_t